MVIHTYPVPSDLKIYDITPDHKKKRHTVANSEINSFIFSYLKKPESELISKYTLNSF